MALNNIIAPRQAVQNSKGQPVAGGQVFLYEPGTTTFITAYSSADLVTPLTQPVRLSGSGRANIWITRDCDLVITDRQGNVVLTEDNANPDALGGEQSGGLVPNGSFEVVTTPPVPDSWVAVDEVGSNNGADSSESTDGANSYRFTSTGSGGGSLTTLDFFPVNDVDPLRVNFDILATIAGVRNIVRVEWYDITFVPISNSDVYDSTSNPLAWTEFNLQAIPPALARFAKLRLIGIDPSVAIAGTTYYDRISVFYPTVVSGVFDNITIQNNEIISTNLNGEIDLRPNGTGPVVVQSSNPVDLTDINNPMNVGLLYPPATNPHLALDEHTIQAKGDATTNAELVLNRFGGTVAVGSGQAGNPSVPDAITSIFRLQSSDENPYGQIDFGSGDPGDMTIQNLAADAALILNVNDSFAGGATDGIVIGSGRIDLYDIQSQEIRFIVPNVNDDDVHVRVLGQLNNNPDPGGPGGDQDAGIYFLNQSEQLVGLVGYDESGSPDLQLANYVADGTLTLQIRLTGPNFRTGLDIGPTQTDLYHVATDEIVLETRAAAAGGIFVDNQLTGAGVERVLTASDLGSVSFPLTPADNEQIQWGTGNDVQQFFDGSFLRFTGDFDVQFDGNTANAHSIVVLNNGRGVALEIEGTNNARINDTFNTGGFVKTYIDMIQSTGQVQLNYGNVPVARTETVAGSYPYQQNAGGFSVNNNATSTGAQERVLTYTDHAQSGGLEDSRNLTTTMTADSAVVAAFGRRTGIHKFEVLVGFQRLGGTSQVEFDFNGSNITSMAYIYDYEAADGSPAGNGASDDAATDQLIPLSGTDVVYVRIQGWVRFSAFSTFEFRWRPTVSQIDSVRRVTGGWMTICPVLIE